MKDTEIGDGPSKTLLAVEVADGEIPWMAPVDLRLDRMSFRINDGTGQGLGSRLGGARVVTVDDMVYTLPDEFRPDRLRSVLTANGREPVDWEEFLRPR